MAFDNYAQFYDLLNTEKNYSQESYYLNDLIKANFNNRLVNILELGSGSAKHAVFLSEFDNIASIFGVELSENMVEIANRKQIPKFKCMVGDIGKLNSLEIHRKFDVAISLFHVISYLTSWEELVNCLESTKNLLDVNGLFIFDVWYTPAVYFKRPEMRKRVFENRDYKIIRIANSQMNEAKSIVNVDFDFFVENKQNNVVSYFCENHRMRHFTTSEIEIVSSFCGFEILESHEFYTKNKPSVETWGVTFVLKKK